MPIYEYSCENCGRFEVVQKITASPLTQCPTCQGEVRRLISAPAVVFKASGFYTTDNRSSSYKSESSSSPNNTTSSTTETKSETKSETKAS